MPQMGPPPSPVRPVISPSTSPERWIRAWRARWPPTGGSTGGVRRAQKHETARRFGRAVSRGGSQLQRRIVQLVPGDREVAAAARANDPLRVSLELGALAAARTHGVTSAPAGGIADGIVGARYDRPAARRYLDHFQEGAGHSERLPLHLHHRLERAQLPHPVPRAAPQLAVEIGLQTSPVLPIPIPIPRHSRTSAVRLSKAEKRRSRDRRARRASRGEKEYDVARGAVVHVTTPPHA